MHHRKVQFGALFCVSRHEYRISSSGSKTGNAVPWLLSDEPGKSAFAMSPSIWDQEFDTFIPFFGGQIDVDKSTEAKEYSDVNSIRLFGSHDAGAKNSSRALTASSPSLTSPASSQTSHRTKKQTHKQRKNKRPLQLNQELGSDNESPTKRKQYLEWNRIAASKCRQKKKDWTHELEEAKRLLQSKHHNLQHEYKTLSEEVLRMKNLLIAHSNCHNHDIDQWIKNEARDFVQQSMDSSINGLGDDTSRSNPSQILSSSAANSRPQAPSCKYIIISPTSSECFKYALPIVTTTSFLKL